MFDMPTSNESGVAGFDMATWLGLVAPAGLPSQITQPLALKLDAFTKDPDIRKQLDALGLLVDGSGPATFSAVAVWTGPSRRVRGWASSSEPRSVDTIKLPRPSGVLQWASESGNQRPTATLSHLRPSR